MQIRDVTIVGAGPAGLAAAIAAKQVGLDYSIIEKGVLVNSIYKFPVEHGVLHHAGAARDWRPAAGLAVRKTDAHRSAALLPARRRYLRAGDRVRRAGRLRSSAKRGSRRDLRHRDAIGQRRAQDPPQPQRDFRDRLFRSSELHRRARREPAARVALLQRVARLLSKERRHRRRRKLRGRDGARAVPLGRDT